MKNVDLDAAILHGDNGDLVGRLVHVDRDDVIATSTLWNRICAGAENIVTALDDDASAGLGSVCPPVGGRYRTAGELDAFEGAEAAGEGTLELHDVVAGDTGMLLNRSIRLETERQ